MMTWYSILSTLYLIEQSGDIGVVLAKQHNSRYQKDVSSLSKVHVRLWISKILQNITGIQLFYLIREQGKMNFNDSYVYCYENCAER